MSKIFLSAVLAATFPSLAQAGDVAQALDAGQTVSLEIPAFGFDSASVPPAGQRAVQQAANYQRSSGEPLTVDGYSDKLGNKRHDQRLSQARANAVKAELVYDGANSKKIGAHGKGILADHACRQRSRVALIKCLARDRRVDISAPRRVAAAAAKKAATPRPENVAVAAPVMPVVVQHQPQPENATTPIVAAPKPAPQPADTHALAVVISSQGPRYAGSEVVTLAGGGTFHGLGWNGSVTAGIPSSHTNSQGGRYMGLSGGLSHKLGSGVIGVDFLHAAYLQGGPVQPLGLSGTLTRINATYSHRLFGGLVGTAKFGRVSQTGEMSIVNLSDSEQYRLFNVGIAGTWKPWKTSQFQADAAFERGLGGSRSNTGADLLGVFDPHYHAVTADAVITQALGSWTAQLKFGGQSGSNGTPQASQFLIGGPGRGAVADTGIYSGFRGYYGSITLNAPVQAGSYQPYVGVDRGAVTLSTGQRQSLQSALIGVRYAAGHVTGGVELAHELGHNNGLAPGDNRVNFFVSVAF